MQSSAIAPPEGVLKKSIQSGKWLSLGYVIQKCLGLVSFFILARLLKPEDFGIMGLVILLPRFLDATADTGFASALIQKEGDIKKFLNPLWTIHVLKGLAIFVVVLAVGPWLAGFLHGEQAILAISLGGIFMLILNLGNIGENYLFKELDFKKIFIRNLVREIAYIIVSIAGALLWPSYWVLFFAQLAYYLTQTIITYFLHPYRPRLSFNLNILRELFHYSKWIVGQSWLDQLYGLLESTSVARLTTLSSLGLYSKAKSMAAVAPGFLGPMLNQISFSAFAKIQTDKQKITDGFLKNLDIIGFFLIPICLLTLFVGNKLVTIVLGTPWLPMASALSIFLFYFFLGNINDLVLALSNALGKPRAQTGFTIVKICTTASLIIPATVRWGINGAAGALLVGMLPVFCLNLRSLTQLTLIKYRDMLAKIITPLLLSLIICLPYLFWGKTLLSLSTLHFCMLLIGQGIAYLTGIWLAFRLFNTGPFATLLIIAKNIR